MEYNEIGGWKGTERDTSRIKAVNSAAKPIHEIAKGVELQIGGWKGTTNFTVAPLDDFKVHQQYQRFTVSEFITQKVIKVFKTPNHT